MNDKYLVKILEPYVTSLGLPLDNRQLDQLQLLAELMLQDPLYKSMSKISDQEEVSIKHFLDSLAPLSLNAEIWKADKILDLGTGGGFPCLPLAIALPASSFVAVDARKKSVDFVARMADKAGIKNVKVCHARSEDLGREKEFRECYDLVICRALSAIRILVEYTLPLVKNGGHAFYYKGPKVQQEMFEAVNAFKLFGISASDVELLQLVPPEIPYERNFVKVLKQKSVPVLYPRKAGLPASCPL